MLSVNYGLYFPKADLATRFGWSSGIGLDVKFKTMSGWVIGGSYTWNFGKNVVTAEKHMFDSIVGSSGEVIDQDGLFSVIRLNERMHTMSFDAGRLFPVWKTNRNSGILCTVGVGAMYHRIDIYASKSKVPQVTNDYEKGYDRLTGGLMFSQYIGYQHLDVKKQMNFNIGFVMNEAFTKSLRTTQFDLRRYDDTKRFDVLSGIRLGVTIPIYTKKREDEEFFED